MRHSVHTLVFRSLKRTHDMFLSEEGQPISEDEKRLIYLISNHEIILNMLKSPTENIMQGAG